MNTINLETDTTETLLKAKISLMENFINIQGQIMAINGELDKREKANGESNTVK